MLLLFVRQLEKLRLGGNARQHGRDRASVVSIGERPRNTLRPLPLRAVDPRTGRHARLTGRVRLAVPETLVHFRLPAIRVPSKLVSDPSGRGESGRASGGERVWMDV